MKKNIGFLAVFIMVLASLSQLVEAGKERDVTDETSETTTTMVFEEMTVTTERPPLPSVSVTDWELNYIGPDVRQEEDMKEEDLVTLSDGAHQIDKRILTDFENFQTAAEKAGFPLVIISAYRSYSYQSQIFEDEIAKTMYSDDLSETAAKKKVMETMTEPGHSEHQLGLAVDVVDEDWNSNHVGDVLEDSYGDEPGAKWIAENSYKYGFIVRYPKDKESITKITYEPWHLRYVGQENATYITENQLTMEEYLNLVKEK